MRIKNIGLGQKRPIISYQCNFDQIIPSFSKKLKVKFRKNTLGQKRPIRVIIMISVKKYIEHHKIPFINF